MATATSSIGGLASGLDTATIISQLMQLEAAPQTRLKARVTTETSEVTALQSLNTKLSALATKAATLAKDTTWSAVTATSSNSSITVATATGATPASFGVTVTAVAKTHQLGFANAAALTDNVTGATSTKVMLNRFDGTPVELDTQDGTLQGLVSAINSPANATGLHATALKTSGGYRLLVESTATGAAQDFDLTAADGSALLGGATVRAGSDASLDLGLGITVTSTSNTFTDLVPGVSLTLAASTAVGTTSSIDLKHSSTDLSTSVSDLVASMNTILSEIETDTAYNATTKKGAVLSGDGLARDLSSKLLSTVFSDSGTSLSKLGISTTRDGRLTFDATAFATAYAADPDGTAAQFTTAGNGFATRVQTLAKQVSDPLNGTISAAITGRQTGITRLQTSIDDWDIRLALRKDTITAQFTALETAMSTMQSQSSWLTSQLASLSNSSSSK
jgi:flagellar hook-associated protein 2